MRYLKGVLRQIEAKGNPAEGPGGTGRLGKPEPGPELEHQAAGAELRVVSRPSLLGRDGNQFPGLAHKPDGAHGAERGRAAIDRGREGPKLLILDLGPVRR